ncbi:MAG: CDP-6-deoxy-delta-3,4-glucoseen reductase [Pseudomonadota bacterium]
MVFKVVLRPSGHAFDVPAGASVLDAGLANGLNMPYSCRAGNCKTCRGKIVRGTVDYGNAHASYLTQEQKQNGFALLCKAKPLSDLEVEVEELVLAQVRPRLMPARVKRIRKPAPDVAILDLRLPMNENLMFAPGQFVDVQLPGGITRSYSIASAPSAEGVIDIELHIRHMPGGLFTDKVFSSLKEGELLRLNAPLGTFYLREESVKPLVLIATGTGIAPILSMLRYAVRKKISRPMRLYWGGRRPSDLYLDEDIRSLASQLDASYVPVLSQPQAGDGWTGLTGYVQHAVMKDVPDLSGYQVYACGSPAMVEAAADAFVSGAGLPEEEFFGDAFLSAADMAATEA